MFVRVWYFEDEDEQRRRGEGDGRRVKLKNAEMTKRRKPVRYDWGELGEYEPTLLTGGCCVPVE